MSYDECNEFLSERGIDTDKILENARKLIDKKKKEIGKMKTESEKGEGK
jgi:hypothetical protein